MYRQPCEKHERDWNHGPNPTRGCIIAARALLQICWRSVDTNGMPIFRLIYASVAAPGLEYDELTSLLNAAARHNSALAISGVLCYGGGAFLQALEGERFEVSRLYNKIVRDPRHAECEILEATAIDTRAFAEWAMKLIGWEDAPTASRRALLLRHSGARQFTPRDMSGGQAFGFLHDLAEAERLRPTPVAA